jgi:uncharacterized protein YggE
MATIDIAVVTSNSATQAALRANGSEMQRVVAAIRGLGIAAADIQTTNFSITAQHPKDKNGATDESRTVGYEVRNSVTVTVSDLEKVGAIIDAAVAAGANSSNSVSFGVKNHAALDDDVLTKATRDARHNAEVMASAENLKVGKMISASNESSLPLKFEGTETVAEYGNNGATVILSGQMSVSASVTVVFAIEQ